MIMRWWKKRRCEHVFGMRVTLKRKMLFTETHCQKCGAPQYPFLRHDAKWVSEQLQRSANFPENYYEILVDTYPREGEQP